MMIYISCGEYVYRVDMSVNQQKSAHLQLTAAHNVYVSLIDHISRLVLYKEKNMLLTEANLARRHGYQMIQTDRRKKVRKSMGAIRHVLGERKRAKIAEHKLYLEELERVGGLLNDMDVGAGEGDSMEDALHTEASEKLSEDKI